MHPHQQPITVAQFGIGTIGAEIARLLLTKPWAKIVAAVDVDPAKLGRDLGDVIGLGRATGITVKAQLEKKPDVVCHSTGSILAEVEPELRALLEAGCHVVSTCEELSFPLDVPLRESLQKVARSHNVTLIGTGVSPGFVMDKLPLTLSAACEELRAISVLRVTDAAKRFPAARRRAGLGMTMDEFRAAQHAGTIRHSGLRESMSMIANGLGIDLDDYTEDAVEPVIAEKRIKSGEVTVEKGQVAGIRQIVRGDHRGKIAITLEIQTVAGARDPRDEIRIDGTPEVHVIIPGGIHGDRAAAAMAVNAIPRAVASRHGLLTMDDLAISYR